VTLIADTGWDEDGGVPSARVVRIPNVDHYVYLTNEAQAVREMNGFLASLY
jgi:non-heme chloroperoxidase